jgi:very-short-patch-repair endonuclease
LAVDVQDDRPKSSLVAPGPDWRSVQAVLGCAGDETISLLFVPAPDTFPESLATAHTMTDLSPSRPIGLIAEPGTVMDYLHSRESTDDSLLTLRRVLIGGLVVLEPHVEDVMNRSVLRENERPLYRSDHEQILHKLIIHDSTIQEAFLSNHRVSALNDRRYEIDLWCEALRLAIEVDGVQHVTNKKQQKRDERRDVDLAGVGIIVVRVHAVEVMSDPTRVLAYLRDRIATRRQEMTT